MKRHPLEREADVLFLVGLLMSQPKLAGARPQISGAHATEILNARRAAAAHHVAIAAGKSEEEAAAAAETAKLTPQCVNQDIRRALGRVREAAEGGAAVFLDDQIAACQDDIDATYTRDEQVTSDLERSRRTRTTQTKGQALPASAEGEKIQPSESVTTTHERAADAAFYMILIRNQELRMKLREEMRLLRLGRRQVEDARRDGVGATLAEAWAGLAEAGPEKARELALKLYTLEAANLARADELEVGPLPAELRHAEALRAKKIAMRLEGLRHFIPLARPDGDRRAYELHVVFGDGDGGEPS